MSDLHADDFKLLQMAVQSSQDDYKELSETWRHLDSKAQGSIAICGILSAGIAAFASRPESFHSGIEQLLVLGSLFALAAGIFFALATMRLRSVEAAPYSGVIQQMIRDLIASGDGATGRRDCQIC
jgi:hypothetical protein